MIRLEIVCERWGYHVSDNSLVEIGRCMPLLQVLKLALGQRSKTLPAATPPNPAPAHLYNTTAAGPPWSDAIALTNPDRVTDATIISLAQGCLELRQMTLSCLSRLTVAAYVAIAALPKLNALCLRRYMHVDHRCITAYSQP